MYNDISVWKFLKLWLWTKFDYRRYQTRVTDFLFSADRANGFSDPNGITVPFVSAAYSSHDSAWFWNKIQGQFFWFFRPRLNVLVPANILQIQENWMKISIKSRTVSLMRSDTTANRMMVEEPRPIERLQRFQHSTFPDTKLPKFQKLFEQRPTCCRIRTFPRWSGGEYSAKSV